MTAKTLAQHDELMKKTETMSILVETNKMLREEKEKISQELQQTQEKVSVLLTGKSLTNCHSTISCYILNTCKTDNHHQLDVKINLLRVSVTKARVRRHTPAAS